MCKVAAACVLPFYCREVGLEPTGDTYTVLMCELAEKGDVSGIEKVGGLYSYLRNSPPGPRNSLNTHCKLFLICHLCATPSPLIDSI